jgi:hypothetical protein
MATANLAVVAEHYQTIETFKKVLHERTEYISE